MRKTSRKAQSCRELPAGEKATDPGFLNNTFSRSPAEVAVSRAACRTLPRESMLVLEVVRLEQGGWYRGKKPFVPVVFGDERLFLCPFDKY